MKIPFSPPDITEAEIEQVAEALRSGWITTGPKTKELEREVADLCGTNRAVCLNSQTACAEMTLRLLGIHEGDEVITCAYTYTASASVVCHVGAKLVLIDTQEDSLEMDYDKLAEAITEKTKVIIPVDLGGVPCDYDRIFSIVEEKKKLFHPANKLQEAIGRVIVMADAAHAFGATWHGKPVGSIADFSNFSFHAVKNFTTAEGGAVAWRDIEGIDNEEIYHQYQLLSLHGQSKDALAKTQLGAWEYDIIGPWFKCNMTDVVAGIGLAQMKRYKGLLARRKEIISRYDAAFKPLTGLILLSKEVVLLISGKEYIKATGSLKLLSIALIFCIFGWIYNQCVLIPARKEKIVLIATLVSALANIAINFVCIPFWRENAVAFSTIVAEAIMMLVCVYVGRKIVRLNAGVAYNICTVCAGCIGIWMSCKFVKHFSLSSIATLVLSILLSCIVYGMCLILMRNKVIWAFFKKKNKSELH